MNQLWTSRNFARIDNEQQFHLEFHSLLVISLMIASYNYTTINLWNEWLYRSHNNNTFTCTSTCWCYLKKSLSQFESFVRNAHPSLAQSKLCVWTNFEVDICLFVENLYGESFVPLSCVATGAVVRVSLHKQLLDGVYRLPTHTTILLINKTYANDTFGI